MGRKPKASTYNWTDKEEETLISWWEETEYLYNLQSKDYRDQDKKQRAYEAIAKKIGTTVKVITDRMSTLRTMLGAVRRKEREAKSGSSAYHPTHRDRIIKAKLGFLERHIKTRKTKSSLPELPVSQNTEGDLFSDNGSVSREVLQHFLTPGGVDGFLGMDMGMDDDENSNSILGGEEIGRFPIPSELLVNMPIADLTATTKIIHLGKPTEVITPANTLQLQESMAPICPPPTASPQAGPSVIGAHEVNPEHMDLEGAATGATNAAAMTPEAPATVPSTIGQQPEKDAHDDPIVKRPQIQPKKGKNTKNNKSKPQVEDQPEEHDVTLKERMSVLGEITKLLKATYGSRRNEVEVWGQFIGLKASRLPEGRRRDRVLVRVEEILNDALYEEDMEY